jgi:hypothetical protein
MSEPRIEFGLDPYGHIVHIEEASQFPHYYRCPACEEFLQVRQGDIRIWYFAHIKAEVDSPVCPIRTEVGLNDWVKAIKKSPMERDEKNRKLQIIVLINPYTNRLNLYGLLPVPNWEDFSNIEQIEKTINSINLCGECLEKPVSSNSFHPSEAEVIIPLKPDAKLFKITISSLPTIPSIVGEWSAPNIRPNDVFVGDSIRAIRVDSNYRVKQGDTVFLILKEQLDPTPPKAKIFRLGSFFVVSFEIDQNTDHLAREFLSHVEIDPNAFQVDIILPPSSEPHAVAPIEGVGGSTALIAIIPPKNLDPIFEVVSVPLEKEKEILLPNIGLGNARFYYPSFPESGSRRLSIHWGGRHKYLNLHTQTREKQETKAAWKNNSKIGIQLFGTSNNLIIPWSENYLSPLILDIKNNHTKGIGFEFIGPKSMVFDLEGYSKKLGIIREDNISMEKAHSIVASWQEEGVNKVVISYGPLGKIPIEFRYNLTNEEIESNLRELPELPKKVNRELARSILGLDKNASIPGGAKKKIRHAILKLRKEKYV